MSNQSLHAQIYAQAIRHVEKQEIDQAVKLLQSILLEDPKHAKASFCLSRIYLFKKNDTQSAKQLCSPFLFHHPYDFYAAYLSGLISFYGDKDFNMAHYFFEISLEKNPHNPLVMAWYAYTFPTNSWPNAKLRYSLKEAERLGSEDVEIMLNILEALNRHCPGSKEQEQISRKLYKLLEEKELLNTVSFPQADPATRKFRETRKSFLEKKLLHYFLLTLIFLLTVFIILFAFLRKR